MFISSQVYEQCYNSLLQDVDAPPVNFALYYESLCPGCRDFFATQLHKTYLALGEEVLNLTLVPFGNARVNIPDITPSTNIGLFCLFDLILYVPSTIFQLNRDGSSWGEPVLS